MPLMFSPPSGNNQVGITFGRFDELFIHRFQHLHVSVITIVTVRPRSMVIALNVTNEALITVTVYKYLQVHHLAQFLVEQCHDAFDDTLQVWGPRGWFLSDGCKECTVGGLFDGASFCVIH